MTTSVNDKKDLNHAIMHSFHIMCKDETIQRFKNGIIQYLLDYKGGSVKEIFERKRPVVCIAPANRLFIILKTQKSGVW